jgi:hypothetical protein
MGVVSLRFEVRVALEWGHLEAKMGAWGGQYEVMVPTR